MKRMMSTSIAAAVLGLAVLSSAPANAQSNGFIQNAEPGEQCIFFGIKYTCEPQVRRYKYDIQYNETPGIPLKPGEPSNQGRGRGNNGGYGGQGSKNF